MNRLLRKIKKRIRSKKGETLIESLASVLVLTVLSLGVAASIQVALKITGDSLEKAEITQGEVNSVVSGASGEPGSTITFTGAEITASHKVSLYNDGGIIAFYPEGAGGP